MVSLSKLNMNFMASGCPAVAGHCKRMVMHGIFYCLVQLSSNAHFKKSLHSKAQRDSVFLEYVITELVVWQRIFDLVNVGLFKYLDNYEGCSK